MPVQPGQALRLPCAGSRSCGVVGAALGLSLCALSLIVYAFGVRQVGYYLFDASDISVYYRYVLEMGRGLRPYVDFAVEYPPLAVTVFGLAAPAVNLGTYAVRFAIEMAAFGLATAVTTALAAVRLWPSGPSPYATAAAFAAGVLGTGALLLNRYDIAVALVLAACLLSIAHGRLAAAALALGLGFALKVIPAILLPVVLVLAPNRAAVLRAVIAFAIGAVAPFLPHLAGKPGNLAGIFTYHANRPLQIESVLATPHWIAEVLGLAQLRIVTSFGAQNLAGPGPDAIARASTVIGVGLLAVTYLAIWRRREQVRERPALVPLAITTVLLAFLLSGKVLSPQYLIWLLPSGSLLFPSFRGIAALLLVSVVLTQIHFPANYDAFLARHPAAILCVVARNVSLVVAYAWTLALLWSGRAAGERSALRGE